MTRLLARFRAYLRPEVPTDADITTYLTSLAAPAHPAGAHPYQPPTTESRSA
ncbi:hypothetical protein ACFFV7_51140 [Nonomuraea spiralis]|uniref:Uncharacterized protein n=1 Tax=Nonomuraea spiralis TaxID=46182 RepID=A0ABV5IYG9_9ACTN|nr:hypothetical protein [Nonomuraea spiralis]GGS88236.1 hypothetical protein GCM10010176_034990 [Nonomuraea spiralis]